MSIKIYNGLIVEGTTTQKSLAFIAATHATIQKLVDEKNARVAAHEITEYIDLQTLKLANHPEAQFTEEELANSPASDIYREIRKKQETCRGGLSREPSIDCDVELIVNMHPKSGKLLCRIQEERVGAYEAFLASTGFAEFGFWDNVDRPGEVPARSWGRRKRMWLEACDAPDSKAFSFKWAPNYLDRSALILALPSFEERVLKNAKNWVTHQEFQKIPKEKLAGASFAPYASVMREVDEALSEQKGEIFEAYCKSQEVMRKTLIPDLAPCIGMSLKSILDLRPR